MDGDGSDERGKAAAGRDAPGPAGPGRPPPEDARRERLAAALRENLRRRKAQARSRRDAEKT